MKWPRASSGPAAPSVFTSSLAVGARYLRGSMRPSTRPGFGVMAPTVRQSVWSRTMPTAQPAPIPNLPTAVTSVVPAVRLSQCGPCAECREPGTTGESRASTPERCALEDGEHDEIGEDEAHHSPEADAAVPQDGRKRHVTDRADERHDRDEWADERPHNFASMGCDVRKKALQTRPDPRWATIKTPPIASAANRQPSRTTEPQASLLATAPQHRPQPASCDAEHLRRLRLVAAGALEGGVEQIGLERVELETIDEQVPC